MNIIERNGILVAMGVDMTEIAGGGERGWNPRWGNEQVVRYIVPNIKPDQTVVDLAGATGRVSFPFSMRGYEVIIVDINRVLMTEGNIMREQVGAKTAKILIKDIRNVTRKDVGNNVGAVVACDALLFLNKKDADKVITEMPKLLGKEGGYIFLNVPATDSSLYRQPEWAGAVKIGNKTLRVRAGCHGGTIDSGFFETGEVDAKLAQEGGSIVVSETASRGNGSIAYHEILARFSPRH